MVIWIIYLTLFMSWHKITPDITLNIMLERSSPRDSKNVDIGHVDGLRLDFEL